MEINIIQLLVTLIIIGVCLYLVQRYIPMDPAIKTVITVIVVIACCLWLLSAFGLLGSGVIMVPRRN